MEEKNLKEYLLDFIGDPANKVQTPAAMGVGFLFGQVERLQLELEEGRNLARMVLDLTPESKLPTAWENELRDQAHRFIGNNREIK